MNNDNQNYGDFNFDCGDFNFLFDPPIDLEATDLIDRPPSNHNLQRPYQFVASDFQQNQAPVPNYNRLREIQTQYNQMPSSPFSSSPFQSRNIVLPQEPRRLPFGSFMQSVSYGNQQPISQMQEIDFNPVIVHDSHSAVLSHVREVNHTGVDVLNDRTKDGALRASKHIYSLAKAANQIKTTLEINYENFSVELSLTKVQKFMLQDVYPWKIRNYSKYKRILIFKTIDKNQEIEVFSYFCNFESLIQEVSIKYQNKSYCSVPFFYLILSSAKLFKFYENFLDFNINQHIHFNFNILHEKRFPEFLPHEYVKECFFQALNNQHLEYFLDKNDLDLPFIKNLKIFAEKLGYKRSSRPVPPSNGILESIHLISYAFGTESPFDHSHLFASAAPVPLVPLALGHGSDKIKNLQKELFNTIISAWKKNDFQDLKVALFQENGNIAFDIFSFHKEETKKFLAPFEAFKSKYLDCPEANIAIKNFCLHFGLYVRDTRGIRKELKSAFPIKEFFTKSDLSIPFASIIIPSLLQLKIHQFARKTKLIDDSLKNNPIRVPSAVIKATKESIALIPFISLIQRDGSEDWNDHISALQQDKNHECYHFICQKIPEYVADVRIDDSGVIQLSLKAVYQLQSVLLNVPSMEFYFLPFSDKLNPDLHHANEKDRIDLSLDHLMENDESQKEHKNSTNRLTQKRNKPETLHHLECEIDVNLLEDVLKKSKYHNDDTPHSVSSKTKKKRVSQENEGTSFDLRYYDKRKVPEGNIPEGELVNIRSEGLSPLNLASINLEASLQNMFAVALSNATILVERKASLLDALKLEQIEYPILTKLANLPQEVRTLHPLIGMLKPYQVDVVNKTRRLLYGGITPLLSSTMGLGKTPMYIELIAEQIMEKEEGVTVIIVPAATRSKTVEELYRWFSEVKVTAFNAYANANSDFNRFWSLQMLKTKKDHIYWELWRPLILASHRLTGFEKVNREKLLNHIEEALSAHIEESLKDNPDLLHAINSIESLLKNDCNYFFNHQLDDLSIIKMIKELALITKGNRAEFPRDILFEPLKLERLLHFDFTNISKIEKEKKQETSQIKKPCSSDLPKLLGKKDAIIVAGYEEIKNFCLTKDSTKGTKGAKIDPNNTLFKTKTRMVIADEAQKYHTHDSALAKFMRQYALALKEQGAPLLPVTATPFENNIDEAITLLSISNPNLIRPASIVILKNMRKRAVEKLADYPHSLSKTLFEEAKESLVKSFVQSYILSENVMRQVILSVTYEHQTVIDSWKEALPKKRIFRTSIDYSNDPMANKADEVIRNVFSREKNEVSILAMSSALKRISIDNQLVDSHRANDRKTSYLNPAKDSVLKESLINLREKILNYKKGDKSALNNHFFVRSIIENEEIQKRLNSSKVIVGYYFEAERQCLQSILEDYYEKKVFSFGKDDKVRNKNISDFKSSDNSVLLLPVKAGGVGLNLGFVDDMIVVGENFNPSTLNQFAHRIVRVGRGGERNILVLEIDNIYNDFQRLIVKEKDYNTNFYLQEQKDLKNKFSLYAKGCLKNALRNFLLSSSIPGYFFMKNISYPILKNKETGQQESLQSILKKTIQQIVDEVDYSKLKQIIDDTTFKPL